MDRLCIRARLGEPVARTAPDMLGDPPRSRDTRRPVSSVCARRSRRTFAEDGEVGAASLAVLGRRRAGGRSLGRSDCTTRAANDPWERDTIVNVLVDDEGHDRHLRAHPRRPRPLLDYDVPVAELLAGVRRSSARRRSRCAGYSRTRQASWPSIRTARSQATTTSTGETMIHALEETTPQWEPGTKNGYHMVTFGWLVGEVDPACLRRGERWHLLPRGGRRSARYRLLHRHACESEDHRDGRRSSSLRPNEILVRNPSLGADVAGERSCWNARLMPRRRSRLIAAPNSRGWRGAEIPGGNGHGNARARGRGVYAPWPKAVPTVGRCAALTSAEARRHRMRDRPGALRG